MLICHNCGTAVKNRVKQCHHCHNFVSSDSAFCLAESTISHSLKIEFETQPVMLNRLVAKELVRVNYLINGNSENGHNKSSGNGNSGNGHSKDGHSGKGHYDGQDSKNQQLSNQQNKEKLEITPASNITADSSASLDNYFLALPTAEILSDKVSVPTNNTTPSGRSPLGVEPEKETNTPLDFFTQLPNTTQEDWGQTKPPISSSHSIKATTNESDQETPPAPPIPDFNAIKTEKDEEKQDKSDFLEEKPSSPSPVEETSPKDPFAIEGTHRRSFSGNFSGITPSKPEANPEESSKSKGNLNFASIIKQIKSTFLSNFQFNPNNPKTSNNKFFGLKPWQIGLSALLVLFLIYKGFAVFCGISTAFMGNPSNMLAGQGQSVTGRWQFVAKWNTGNCDGQLVLHQNNNQIFGQGIDSHYGPYKFNGIRSGSHLDFLKQYYVGNAFVGHTIEFHGDLDPSSKPLFISGSFSKEYMEGGKWRGKPVTVAGIWEAEMIQPLIEDDSSNGFVPLVQKRDERPGSSMGNFFTSLAKNGSWIAGGILAGGLLLYILARKLIGPDGWIGIWDKQKYVPAQFMKEHKKEKAQLSRPIGRGSLILGQRWEWKPWFTPFFWVPRYLALPPDIRTNSPHVLILGGGEKGKSRLMAKMITHDIDSADRAIILVDSDGDLADLLLHWIASHPNSQQIAQKTIIIDPTSNLPAPSFNPLELPDDNDLQNAASSIVNGFKAIYHEPPGSQNQWSPQTAHILRNCAMLLMANGKTLLDLPTLLQDNDFRDILLEKLEQKRKDKAEYSTLLETWGQYKRLARTEQWINWYEPILNRIGPTLINQRLRPILTQPKGEISLKNIIAEKKILIVKIPKGQLHDDANLLGSLIVTGVKQAAISLCTENKINDRTAALYLDEFDHFIEKETLEAITTETKKFQLGFIGATKTLQHLPEDWRNQIEGNMGTMCVFALTKKDGDMLGPRMFRVSGRKAKHRTLMNIFNPINTSPQFDFISDEEKFNIDRILAQAERGFYAYRVGSEAGIFRMRSLAFDDMPAHKVDPQLIELIYKNR